MKHKIILVSICIFSVLLIGLYIWFRLNYQYFTISGNSMLPSYKNGDFLIVKKDPIKYRIDDVVIYLKPDEKQKVFKVGRIYSTPNKEAIFENKSYGIAKEKEYFILGDNLLYSQDSRHTGFVKEEQIKGLVIKSFSL